MSSSNAPKDWTDNPWLTNGLVLIGIGVSVTLIGVSALLNFRVGYRTADTELDGWIYGLGAATGDGLKAIAPFAAAWGWRNRGSLAVTAALAVFVVFSWYSLSAAIGFAAHHRVFKQTEQSGTTERRQDLRREYERIEARLTALGVQRSKGEIGKGIAAVLARPAGERGRTVDQVSSGCTLSRRETRAACAEVAVLAEEAERARDYVKLSATAKDLRARLDAVKGGSASGDPQLDALEELAKMTPFTVTRRNLEVGLSLLVALFIELGSGVGLYIATTPWRGRGPQPEKTGGRERKKQPSKADKAEVTAKKEGAMKLGLVEDFMLERLVPSRGRELSGGDLFTGYRTWCAERTLVALKREEFAREFVELAADTGIVCSGSKGNGVYRDVSISKEKCPR